MSDDRIEHYDPPDKRKRPSIPLISSRRSEFERTATPVADEFINSTVSSVSTENIERWINLLTSYLNRHSKLPVMDDVAIMLQTEIRNLGYSDVYFHNYIHSDEGKDYRLKNVICNKPGKTSSKVILICAHYDTIVFDERGRDIVSARAPGADDNASGVASILEMARLLAKVDLDHTIQFVFFSGEEQGLWGSSHYAKHIKDNSLELYRVNQPRYDWFSSNASDG